MKKAMAIVGCGTMGCDVAAIFLSKGWRVEAVSRSVMNWDVCRGRIRRSLKQLGCEMPQDGLKMVAQAADVDWTEMDFGFESVPEDFELKRYVFETLDDLVPEHVPLLTNTSGLRISKIAELCRTRHRMGGLHFFLPAHLVPAVEVVKGEFTCDRIIPLLSQILRSVGRVPIAVAKDVPGFLANRIQHALMREAFAVIDEGLGTPEDVDAAVRYGFGFRYVAAGPILQKELSGLDTQFAAGRSIYPSLHNGSIPSKVLSDLVAAGRLGAKTGGGFWQWTPHTLAMERDRFESTLMEAAKLLESSPRLTRLGERSEETA